MNSDYDPSKMKKQVWDKEGLITEYGGVWCDCIDRVVEEITPARLAAYCIGKKYRQIHPPQEDDIGIRYAYFLSKHTEVLTIGDKNEVEREVVVAAMFGEFKFRGYETLKSCLDALIKISKHEGRPAQAIAEEVAAIDDSNAPKTQVLKPEEEQRGIMYGGHAEKRRVLVTGTEIP